MSTVKGVAAGLGITVAVCAGITAIAFGTNGLDYWINKVFAPANEQVRHQTFECSASHGDGIAREIRQYQDQYGTADTGGRVIIRQRVLQEAEAYTCPDYPLPVDVQLFVQSIR